MRKDKIDLEMEKMLKEVEYKMDLDGKMDLSLLEVMYMIKQDKEFDNKRAKANFSMMMTLSEVNKVRPSEAAMACIVFLTRAIERIR